MVAHRSSIFATDEELGKRDDDRKTHRRMGSWNVRQRPVSHWKRKRILAVVAAGFFLWLFIHNLPTDLKPIRTRYPYSATIPKLEDLRLKIPPDQAASPALAVYEGDDEDGGGQNGHDYNGPIEFYDLASSLRSIAHTVSFGTINQNVLFAASDLKSAAALIPIACDMSSWKRNNVHFTLMGRDESTFDEIKKMNGANEESCDVHWHDARPDSASVSSDGRMEGSVAGALGHIDSFMKPQVAITADSVHEDGFFSKAFAWKAKDLSIPLIEIPQENPESLSWISRLGAMALRSWHKASVDILIQVPTKSSGSLVRLLRSLSAADYSGFEPPRLVIELPPTLEPATHAFLKSFRWPPQKISSYVQSNQLIIRRRIPETRLDPELAAVRFIESFYPSSTNGPHVLLLSPQAELSRAYFHYLKLQLLEYKCSSAASRSSRDLIGISLETPSTHLNGSDDFSPPAKTEDEKKENAASALAPFLWQAPNSYAALYFSDKWMELHSFLTKRDSAAHHPSTKAYHKKQVKQVSEKQPAWTEFFLEFMRIRGYYLLYPSLGSSVSTSSQSLAVIHNDLYMPPEEFSKPDVPDEEFAVSKPNLEPGAALEAPADYLATQKSSDTIGISSETPLLRNLEALLPATPNEAHEGRDHAEEEQDFDHHVLGDEDEDFPSFAFGVHSRPSMQSLATLPLLDFHGAPINRETLQEQSSAFAQAYRQSGGGCSLDQAREKLIEPESAEDLFCINEDQVEPFADGPVVEYIPQSPIEEKQQARPSTSNDEADTNLDHASPTKPHSRFEDPPAEDDERHPHAQFGNQPDALPAWRSRSRLEGALPAWDDQRPAHPPSRFEDTPSPDTNDHEDDDIDIGALAGNAATMNRFNAANYDGITEETDKHELPFAARPNLRAPAPTPEAAEPLKPGDNQEPAPVAKEVPFAERPNLRAPEPTPESAPPLQADGDTQNAAPVANEVPFAERPNLRAPAPTPESAAPLTADANANDIPLVEKEAPLAARPNLRASEPTPEYEEPLTAAELEAKAGLIPDKNGIRFPDESDDGTHEDADGANEAEKQVKGTGGPTLMEAMQKMSQKEDKEKVAGDVGGDEMNAKADKATKGAKGPTLMEAMQRMSRKAEEARAAEGEGRNQALRR